MKVIGEGRWWMEPMEPEAEALLRKALANNPHRFAGGFMLSSSYGKPDECTLYPANAEGLVGVVYGTVWAELIISSVQSVERLLAERDWFRSHWKLTCMQCEAKATIGHPSTVFEGEQDLFCDDHEPQ